MATTESFKETAARVAKAFNTSPTREQRVRRQMGNIQRENEENFLKQFRENDFRELVALMGGGL